MDYRSFPTCIKNVSGLVNVVVLSLLITTISNFVMCTEYLGMVVRLYSYINVIQSDYSFPV